MQATEKKPDRTIHPNPEFLVHMQFTHPQFQSAPGPQFSLTLCQESCPEARLSSADTLRTGLRKATRCSAGGILGAVVFLVHAVTGMAAVPPGVPEPGLVIWGSVVNQTNAAENIAIQSAHWSVSDGAKTAVYSGQTRPAVRIVSVAGQSYYILQVPFDTRQLGAIALSDPIGHGMDSFELKAASPPAYTLTPTINGVLASVRSVNGAPALGESVPITGFTSQARGRVVRVDLAILPTADSYELWAAAMFGDANLPQAARGADPDGDGMTNEQEWAAGTNPLSAESVLQVLTFSVDPNANEATLSWTSVAGRDYIIQGASVTEGPWVDLAVPVTGSGGATEISIDAGGGEPVRFYRIRLVP
jgi:hypothetical protein